MAGIGDDNDNDVADILNANGSANDSVNSFKDYAQGPENKNFYTPSEATRQSNMIPIINVTPHSPAAVSKYSNIFEDTLSQLQNIRESIVQMKNSSAQNNDALTNYWPIQAAMLNGSLPDLSASGYKSSKNLLRWIPQKQYYQMVERRNSWTAIDDLSVTNKSASLSSLESEEPEPLSVLEQRRRSARNSTGGISTHSLNEAELVRDFQRIAAKRNLVTENRITLQKSVSTSSIVPKGETVTHHIYDSEDENQILFRDHFKIEASDCVEKRRKRGSLFFRKKKEKKKIKSIGERNSCESCGALLAIDTGKGHQSDCKGKTKIGAVGQKVLAGNLKKGAVKNDSGQDQNDGQDLIGSFNDESLLIRSEFISDSSADAPDIGADPILGISAEEPESWSPSVPKEVLAGLKPKQIKRQEQIYEFIRSEKHHCQTLLVMKNIFIESLERHFPSLCINKIFPRLGELTELHFDFLRKLRQKQREQYVVDSIADILLDFFSLEKAQRLRLAYGEFCANHRTANEHFKTWSRDQTFEEWHNHCLSNPLLKKKGIPECNLFVTQRLTKYPLLIESLLKSAREDKLESDKLQLAYNLVKALLIDVNACVAEKELRERQISIYNRIDPKSESKYKNKPFRKTDVGVESHRRLKFEGLATLMPGRSKSQLVLVVVLTDCLCFLSENSAHNKYTFYTPEQKAGVVPLQKLLIREKAGAEERCIYIISPNPSFPGMYELKVQQPKDKNTWIQSIRQAVLECPSSEVIKTEDLTAEEKLRIGVSKRDLLDKIRQKDIDHAILLEEKMFLQLNLLKEQKYFSDMLTTITGANAGGDSYHTDGSSANASSFLATFGSYKDLVDVDCDTNELWKYVLSMVQGISQLASLVYTASTGLPVSRSVSSVGEKQSDTYYSPTLPKRAETFAGFDEKRGKGSFPCRDSTKMSAISPRLQELEEKHDIVGSSSLVTSSSQSANGNGGDEKGQTMFFFDDIVIKDHNYAALQISHQLHTLLSIICQQMTTIHNLQLQLALYRENPRTPYTHKDQLEELRNLQDKLQEDKVCWIRQKEQQEQEIEEKRDQLIKLQEQTKAEQEDIKQQREQLYRKMELLSNQGLLLSPNTPLMINNPFITNTHTDDTHYTYDETNSPNVTSEALSSQGSADRRKDKWRTASTNSKTPPVNLLSATNAPKLSQTSIKQKIPMKLSSHSSAPSSVNSKIDKSASFNVSQNTTCTQMLPMKLVDKRFPTSNLNTQVLPQHGRTGSSPAIVQHQTISKTGFPHNDTSPALKFLQRQITTPTLSRASPTSSATIKSTTKATLSSSNSNQSKKPEEEEIYF